MFTALFKQAVILGLILTAIGSVSGRQGKVTSETALKAISPVPGVRITAVEQQRSRASGGKAIFQQYMQPVQASPGPHRIGALGKLGPRTRSNTKSAAAVLGAMQRRAAAEMRSKGGDAFPVGYENITADYGMQYSILASIDGVSMRLILDTGNADTWAIASNYTCVDWSGEPVDDAACWFGRTFPAGRTFRHGAIEGQHLWLQYGDGETVSGPVGYSDVEVGGITVAKQQLCLANKTYWFGNNLTSGVVGLAYPSLGHVYRGNDEDDNDWFNRVQYPPLFSNMVSQGLVKEAFFGIALERNSSGGLIGWGGMPEVTGLDYAKQAFAPILITQLNNDPLTGGVPSFYTIVPDGFQYGLASDYSKFPFVVDTGTTLMYLPPRIAAAVNSAFDPPAVYMWRLGAYYTSCTAIAPSFAVVIGGAPFTVSPVDMIFRNYPDPVSKLCMTAVASGGTGPYILGDVFLNNVLVGFDLGAGELKLVGRPFY